MSNREKACTQCDGARISGFSTSERYVIGSLIRELAIECGQQCGAAHDEWVEHTVYGK